MPVQRKENKGGKTLIVHVTGMLAKAMRTFALWEEIKFDISHFADVYKIAAAGIPSRLY